VAKKSYYEYFQGKTKWCKADKPDSKFDKWSVQLFPDEASLKKFRDLQDEGVLTRLKKNDENQYFFQLSRPHKKTIKGEEVIFQPPRLLDKEGRLLPQDTQVGNDSDVSAKVQVYYYPKPTGGQGIAIRWEELKIDNLVPYNPPDPLPRVDEKTLKEYPPEKRW
jgi:hypothetical protein